MTYASPSSTPSKNEPAELYLIYWSSFWGPSYYLMPASLAEFTVTIVDGKILKDVAKRLMVSRGKAGKLYGGKLLVAYVPAEGLARSFVADLDGETNDAKLIPLLIPRARKVISGPRRWVLDRQFCDLTQPVVLAQEGDHYVIRFHPKNSFELDPSRPLRFRRPKAYASWRPI